MARTWILVGHEAGARVFENRGPGKGLDLVETIEHVPDHAGEIRDALPQTLVGADKLAQALDRVLGVGRELDGVIRSFGPGEQGALDVLGVPTDVGHCQV